MSSSSAARSPAGTTGAVVSVYDDALLVEIVGPDGRTLDTIRVPGADLNIKRA